MKRKIVKHGSNTLTVSLPAKWCKKFDIRNGDEIDIEELDKNLLIKIEDRGGILKKISINIDNLDQELIWRHFISTYRAGYDEIILKFSDLEKIYDIKLSSLRILEKKWKMSTIEIIRDVVSRCIGMEIIDQGKGFCVIKDLGETSQRGFDNTLRRIFLLLLSMAEESLTGIKEGKESLEYSAVSTDTNIDKFTDFCMRVLNKIGYKEFGKTNILYAIIIMLEILGDDYKKIAMIFSELETKKINPQLIAIYEKINELLNSFYELFYKFDDKKAIKIYEQSEQINEDLKIITSKLNKREIDILHYLKKIKTEITDLIHLKIDFDT